MSVYVQSIQIGVIAFFGIFVIALIPYMVYQYRKWGQVNPWRFLVSFSFICYLLVAYAMTIFPLPDPAQVAKMAGPTENLQLFSFVREFINYSPFHLMQPSSWILTLKDRTFIQPFFNLLLTLPFGFYLGYLFKRKFRWALLFSFLLTLSFELIQRSALFGLYPRPYRLFDVDDLLINTLGSLIGFGAALLLAKVLPSLEAGKLSASKISVTRRLIAFLIDFGIYVVLSIFLKTPFLTETLVFLLIPILLKSTLGQWLLKTRITGKRLQIGIRQLLSFVNYLPIAALVLFLTRSGSVQDSELGANYLLILLSLILMFFPILDILFSVVSKSKEFWYERLSKTNLEERK